MGLSRNKVAVSEGAAGSPPFYGDSSRTAKAERSWKKPGISESIWRIKIEKRTALLTTQKYKRRV